MILPHCLNFMISRLINAKGFAMHCIHSYSIQLLLAFDLRGPTESWPVVLIQPCPRCCCGHLQGNAVLPVFRLQSLHGFPIRISPVNNIGGKMNNVSSYAALNKGKWKASSLGLKVFPVSFAAEGPYP